MSKSKQLSFERFFLESLKHSSLRRFFLVRIIPTLLVLLLLDLLMTWVIMRESVIAVVAIENIFLLVIVGQVLLILLFGLLVFHSVRVGLDLISEISEQIDQRNEEDLQPIELTLIPTELVPLIEHINDLFGRLNEALLAQRRFIGHAAHQLRTPLATLRLESEMMLAQKLPEDIHQRVERIRTISNRMIHLGEQLLVLARADPSSRPQDSFAPLDLCEWLIEAGSHWIPKAKKHHIDIQLIKPGGQEVWIDGDRLLLEEVLGNLIDNALKYASARKITLTVGVSPPSFSVEDDGVGIDPQDRPHIFEAFYRSPRVSVNGSGLGLQIVKEIASAHGAWWSLESLPEIQGTKITLMFPRPK